MQALLGMNELSSILKGIHTGLLLQLIMSFK